MAEISEDYVGPGARWAMLVEDWPRADHREEWLTGDQMEDADIPDQFRPKKPDGVCRCTITFGTDADRPNRVAYRYPDVRGQAHANSSTAFDHVGWEALSSKALNRALKDAGYPASAAELKLMLLWRRRNAEIEALRSGRQLPSPAPHATDEKVIDQAAASGLGDPEQHEEQAPAVVSDETLGRVNALSVEARRRLDDFLEQREWDYPTLDAQNGQGNVCRAFLANLEKQTQPDRPQPDGTAEPAQPASQPPPAHMPNKPPSMVSESAKSGVRAAVQEAAVDEDQFCERLHAAGIPTEVDLPWTAEQLWAASRIADQMIAAKRPPTAQPRSAKRPAGRADLEAMIGGWDKPKVVSELNARKLPTAGRIDDLRDRLYRAMISDQPAEQAS